MTKKCVLNKQDDLCLKANSLSKRFNDLEVFKNLNFDLKKGEILAIMGPSGIGKTTLINILLGLDKDFEGEVLFYETKKIAAVFQEDRLLPWKNVYENIKIVNPKSEKAFIKELLDLLKLTKFADYPPKKLSGGMKQRVSIARAINYDADLIILDEPLKSTDKDLSFRIISYLKNHIKETKKSMIFITHDISYAELLSDKIYNLNKR